MAARTGAGTGVVVALVVFVLSTIFLLILTIVFYSKEQKATEDAAKARDDLARYITPLEQNSEKFKAIVSNSGSGRSAMGFLVDEKERILSRVVGTSNADVSQVENTITNYGGSQGDYLVSVLDGMKARLAQAQSEVNNRDGQVRELEQRLQEKDALIEETRRSGEADVQAVRDLIQQFVRDVQDYGQDVDAAKRSMIEVVDRLERTFDNQVESLERTLDDVRADLATKDRQLSEMRSKLGTYQQYSNTDPARLVDATVIDNARNNQVFISRGSRDHVTLGMTFEVYDNATMIGLDEFGNVIPGKASIQVIDVNDSTATAVITRASPGRPVVKNDVVANAIYDPDKTFLFLVHGKFDFNGDGRATDAERELIGDLIRDWGGKVAGGEDIRGDLDFLLLGMQPPQPPPLRSNPDPIEVDIWIKQKAAVDKYNQLLRDAMEAGIPVLNQNRFFVLTGHTNN